MALEGDINVPGGGKVPKKAAVVGLVAVGGLIVLYYVRKKNSAPAAPAGTTTDQYPPDGTTGNPQDPYSTDPATGQTYGDEAVGSGGTYGAFGTGSPFDGSGGQGNLGGDQGSSGGPPFSSNSAWADWVIQQAQQNNPNTDVGALTDAIGLYLSGQPLDAAQKQLVFDAIAIGGDPPVAGANGYPPKLQTGGGSGGGTAHNPVDGLRVTSAGTTGVDIEWKPSAGATSYTVKATRGNAGLTGTTSARVHDINKPGHEGASSVVTVIANPAQAGARHATITVKTKR